MRFLVCSICFLVFSPYLDARDVIFKGYKINPDSTILAEENLHGYTIPDSILDKLLFKDNLKYLDIPESFHIFRIFISVVEQIMKQDFLSMV